MKIVKKLLDKKKEYVKQTYDRIRSKVCCQYCNNDVCRDAIARDQRSEHCQEIQKNKN